MTIWVDADACPVVIREILFRAAARTNSRLELVANRPLKIPDSDFIAFTLVDEGYDIADAEIARRAAAGDLVVTSDIPLAAQVIESGCQALDFRGELSTGENIRDRLAMRNFMETLRGTGAEVNSGPPPLGPRDRQAFANALDSWLTRNAL